MLTTKYDYVLLELKVKPASRVNELVVFGNECQLKTTAPPVDGKANESVISFLSKTLGIPKSYISVVRGATSRQKTIKLTHITQEDAHRLLEKYRFTL